MLSWKDEDVFAKKASSLNKAGSLTRSPAGAPTAQRTGSLRKSVDMPTESSSRNSMDSPANSSPANSLPKASSLLRSPGNTAEGTIGAEGWWHHMDHSQMNEPPVDASKKGESKGFTPQFGLTGQSRSLWADEPVAPAPTQTVVQAQPSVPVTTPAPESIPASPAAAQPLADPAPVSVIAPMPAATPAHEAAPTPAAVPLEGAAAPTRVAPGSDAGTTIQNAGTTGWWAHMDNSILNQPADTAPLAPGAVRKGERIMGGGFTPQFNVAGGNRYGSIF